MAKILFLPGAGASPDFWKPVGALLPADWPKEYFGWPGLGDQPHDPAIKGIGRSRAHGRGEDGRPGRPGGAVHGRHHRRAACDRAAAEGAPAGADRDFGRRRHGGARCHDWRPGYRKSFPGAAAWITEPRICRALPIEQIAAPTLLLWGDADPISPAAVGRHLAARIPNARLHIVAGGDHDLAADPRGRDRAADRAASRLIRPSAGVPAG